MLIDSLDAKRNTLEELERAEQEASRLDEALSRGLSSTKLLDRPNEEEATNGVEAPTDSEPPVEAETDTEADQLPSQSIITSSPSKIRKYKSNMSFLGAISHTLHGIMDVDPEATRRNSIGKTRESIQGVSYSYFLDCLTN